MASLSRSAEGAVIDRATQVAGVIEGSEDLLIRGRLEGRLELDGALTIEEGAVVQAEVRARSAVIGGILIGRLEVSGPIHLLPSARVVADLSGSLLTLERGAQLAGHLEIAGDPDGHRATRGPRRSEPEAQTETPTRIEPATTQIDPSPPPLSNRPRRTPVKIRRPGLSEERR